MDLELLLPLEEIKAYSRVYHSEDDVILTRLRVASVRVVEGILHRTFEGILEDQKNACIEKAGEDENAIAQCNINTYSIPEDILQAVYMTIGHYYENRESTISIGIRGVQELPMGVTDMLAPHKDWTV